MNLPQNMSFFSDQNKNAEKFVTGSSYAGEYKSRLMHGFGRYTYPDGTTYTGFFDEGKLNGFGCLQLPAPYKLDFKVHYSKGRLQKVEELLFDDGLEFVGEFKENKIKVDKWKYLTEGNRCFANEVIDRNDIIRSSDDFFKRYTNREIFMHEYFDIGEGMYFPDTGFVRDRRDPLPGSRYISCKEEQDFIKKSCYKISGDLSIPNKDICSQILELNRRELNKSDKHSHACDSYLEKAKKDDQESSIVGKNVIDSITSVTDLSSFSFATAAKIKPHLKKSKMKKTRKINFINANSSYTNDYSN
ncbi:MORN repeat-containing protein 5-like [Teleopsis dalmanni]|uniref:MORN repeat-containing protein 5-like n=1 Tax=Teleopsis dalmanni TaxID=139649 RepID=UPI0018CFDE52|nr:MORN repeat-containing protein 5-like [Teleopsis dalmanni]